MKLVRKIMHPAFVKIRRQLNRSKLLRFGSAVSDFPNVLEVRTSFSTREIHLRCPFFLISSSLGQNGGHMTRFFWIWSKLVSSNLMIKNIVTIFVTVLISSEKLLVIYIFRHADVSGIPVFFPGLKTFFYFISWYRSQRDFCSAYNFLSFPIYNMSKFLVQPTFPLTTTEANFIQPCISMPHMLYAYSYSFSYSEDISVVLCCVSIKYFPFSTRS